MGKAIDAILLGRRIESAGMAIDEIVKLRRKHKPTMLVLKNRFIVHVAGDSISLCRDCMVLLQGVTMRNVNVMIDYMRNAK